MALHYLRHINSLKSYFCYQHIALMSIFAKSLKYTKFGKPADVLQIVEEELPEPRENQVLVRILVAPINPADVNTIQGKYPVQTIFPAIPGNECVAEIIKIGSKVKKLSEGKHVIPAVPGLGTWTTHAIFEENQVLLVPNKIGLIEAATLTVNPCTAFRMLKDFICLKPGDCIIQNGANSAVGQAVHQLCRVWGIKSVGVVRDRDDIKHLKIYLKSLGANKVFTEEEIRSTNIFKDGILPRPNLAFNCIGGKSSTELSRHLADKGIMVTYGGMSREPVTISTASLIFKDISFRGFWMTRWLKDNANSEERKQMFQELCDLMEKEKFIAPIFEMVPFEKLLIGTNDFLNFKGFTGKKYILDMMH